MRLALVGGTGDQGFGLALRFAAAGHEVVIGSREEERALKAAERAMELLSEHGYEDATVEGKENEEAVSDADVVLLTVPFFAVIETVRGLRDALPDDAIIVDVTVPLETAIGGRPTRTITPWEGSAAETVQSLVEQPVVSAFENVSAELLRELDREVECDVVVCSDDEDAKRTVMELAEDIPGVRAIDGGPLANARIVESITALLIGLNQRYGKKGIGIRFTGIE
ncbi:MAG: NADPH-dependent F420 reductase [Euryarchaeota archaeon]